MFKLIKAKENLVINCLVHLLILREIGFDVKMNISINTLMSMYMYNLITLFKIYSIFNFSKTCTLYN